MEKNVDEIPEFKQALENGQIEMKKNWHDVNKDSEWSWNRSQRCECQTPVTGDKGAYTRIKIQVDNKTVYYYHQKPVYMKYNNGDIVIADPYYKKLKVLETLRNALPKNYYIEQIGRWQKKTPRNRSWYLTEPNAEKPYTSRDNDKTHKINQSIKIPVEEQVTKNL